MRRFLNQIEQCVIAVVVATLIMNFGLSFYNRAAGWIDRQSGSTTAIYNPGSSMLHGTEGRGYHRIDARGYVNDTSKLAEKYVIAVGASYTQGKEVNNGYRYTDLLNSWLGYNDEAFVYNVSQDAYYFPKIVKGFSALTQEFPQAEKIIIEIGRTDFAIEEMEDSLNQRAFDEIQTGERIKETLTWKKKVNIKIKEYSPLLYNINSKVQTLKSIKPTAENDSGKQDADLIKYRESLERVFTLLTQIYDKEIIILYHPRVSIGKDGNLNVFAEDTDEVFRKVCTKYDVSFVDMSEKFKQSYNDSFEVPYGFSNTTLGQGHFSAAGHRMVAEELIKYLENQ